MFTKKQLSHTATTKPKSRILGQPRVSRKPKKKPISSPISPGDNIDSYEMLNVCKDEVMPLDPTQIAPPITSPKSSKSHSIYSLLQPPTAAKSMSPMCTREFAPYQNQQSYSISGASPTPYSQQHHISQALDYSSRIEEVTMIPNVQLQRSVPEQSQSYVRSQYIMATETPVWKHTR